MLFGWWWWEGGGGGATSPDSDTSFMVDWALRTSFRSSPWRKQ